MSRKRIDELCQDVIDKCKEATDCPCDPCILEFYGAEDTLLVRLIEEYSGSEYQGELYPEMYKRFGSL